METQEKPQLHQSMLDTLSHCGEQFRRRYGARFGIADKEEIVPPGTALIVGSAVHSGVEHNLRHYLENDHSYLPREQVEAITRDNVLGIWESEGVALSPDEAINVSITKGQTVDMAIGLVRLHYDKVAPTLHPHLVEHQFVLELPRYPFDLSGRIDMIEKDGEAVGVVDVKTKGRRMAANSWLSIQFMLYSLAVKKMQAIGRLPDYVRYDVLLKNKTPLYAPVTGIPSEDWLQPMFHRIERFAEILTAAKEGRMAFTPAKHEDWVCTEKWCGYARTCPFWTGR